jgi:outer membrane protein assembly factor BamB
MTLWLITVLSALTVARPTAPGSSPLIPDASLQQLGLVKFWQASLPLGTGDAIRDGFLVDEALYVTSEQGNIYALKADVGLLRWGAALTEPGFRIHAPRHSREDGTSGPAIVATTTEIFVIDRYSGEIRKRFAPEFATGSAAVGLRGMLFVGGSDGRFYSLQLDHPFAPTPPKRWDVRAGGPVTTTPLLYDAETLVFASQAGKVFACLAGDKTFLWSFTASGAIEGDPAMDASGVYVSSADRSLYKLHKATGSRLWRARFSDPLTEGPTLAAQTVYQYGPRNGLTALDAMTGKEKWSVPDGRMLAAHSPAGDLILTSGRRLAVVDHESGKRVGAIDASQVLKAVPNSTNDWVYLLGQGGQVLCVRLDDAPYLKRQQVAAAREQLNQPPGAQKKVEPIEPLVREPDPLEDDPLRSKKDIQP